MGAATLVEGEPTYDFAKFPQKLHEIERIWTPGGGASLAPSLRSATVYYLVVILYFPKTNYQRCSFVCINYETCSNLFLDPDKLFLNANSWNTSPFPVSNNLCFSGVSETFLRDINFFD